MALILETINLATCIVHTADMDNGEKQSSDLPHQTSSLVEMFEVVYAYGDIPISESDPEDQSFKSAFAAAQMEKAGYTCVGSIAAAAGSLQFQRRLMVFAAAAPLIVLLSNYLPHPLHQSMQTAMPFMARKYESQVAAYYQKVYDGPSLSWKARTEEERQAEHKERSMKILKTAIHKREIR